MYIYIYIYITWECLWSWVSSILQSSDRVKISSHQKKKKKNWLIWLNFCSKIGGYLCIWVPKSVCYWMLVGLCMCCWLRVLIYARLRMYWNTSWHIYIFTHFPAVCNGKGWDDGRECEKGRVGERGEMDCCNQNTETFGPLLTHLVS